MSYHRAKLKEAILYIASHPRVRDLGLTKLYKLIYFAEVAHLREYGVSITESEYIKYPHGPVPSRAERCLKELKRQEKVTTENDPYHDYELCSIRAAEAPEFSALSEPELKTLDAVCARLGSESATSLSDRSHDEPAWICAGMQDKLSKDLMFYGSAEDPEGL